jgi:hypothetical protein
MYISTTNPLILSYDAIVNKIMSISIEKFNQLKIRSIFLLT